MTGPVKGQGIHANTAGIQTKRSGYLAQWMCLLPLENEEIKFELFSCLSCLVFFLFSLFSLSIYILIKAMSGCKIVPRHGEKEISNVLRNVANFHWQWKTHIWAHLTMWLYVEIDNKSKSKGEIWTKIVLSPTKTKMNPKKPDEICLTSIRVGTEPDYTNRDES